VDSDRLSAPSTLIQASIFPSYERPKRLLLFPTFPALVEDAGMPFPHRVNCDGTIDSICDCCFATVATSTVEANLASPEAAHICEQARVEHFRQMDSNAKRPPQNDPLNRIANDGERVHQQR
jgi:hypothetical protein